MERRTDRGVDGAGAFGDRLRLRAAFIAGHRVQLAVGVRDADRVAVDEREMSHAGTGEGFDGPGTHAAEPDHEEGRAGQTIHAGAPVEATDAGEALEMVRVHPSNQAGKRPHSKAEASAGAAVLPPVSLPAG